MFFQPKAQSRARKLDSDHPYTSAPSFCSAISHEQDSFTSFLASRLSRSNPAQPDTTERKEGRELEVKARTKEPTEGSNAANPLIPSRSAFITPIRTQSRWKEEDTPALQSVSSRASNSSSDSDSILTPSRSLLNTIPVDDLGDLAELEEMFSQYTTISPIRNNPPRGGTSPQTSHLQGSVPHSTLPTPSRKRHTPKFRPSPSPPRSDTEARFAHMPLPPIPSASPDLLFPDFRPPSPMSSRSSKSKRNTIKPKVRNRDSQVTVRPVNYRRETLRPSMRKSILPELGDMNEDETYEVHHKDSGLGTVLSAFPTPPPRDAVKVGSRMESRISIKPKRKAPPPPIPILSFDIFSEGLGGKGIKVINSEAETVKQRYIKGQHTWI